VVRCGQSGNATSRIGPYFFFSAGDLAARTDPCRRRCHLPAHFDQRFSQVASSFRDSANVILLLGLIAGVLLILSFQQIISYFLFVAVLFFDLAVASLFILRHRHPFTPIAFLMLVALLLALLDFPPPLQAAFGCIVLSGLLVYFYLRKARRGLQI
jgi:amino acid transporter